MASHSGSGTGPAVISAPASGATPSAAPVVAAASAPCGPNEGTVDTAVELKKYRRDTPLETERWNG